MLLNNFYFVLSSSRPDTTVSASIRFNTKHEIFEGHFPGTPIVPGVCMIQIVRELVEEVTNTKLLISEGDNIKFLNMIDPRQHEVVQVNIDYKRSSDRYAISAAITSGELTFFKFSGSFQIC
jgi:3-hydroxyacyl-[acyl-carrier-protein] dehydratase